LDALPTVNKLIQQGIEAGLHLGAQVYVSCEGKVLADAALGEAKPGVAMTADSIMIWMSATKPVTAIALAQQWELGKIDLDRPVAEEIPGFAQGGKERITPRHLLTHTGGFRATRFRFPNDDWDQIIRIICETPIERGWIPGERAGYHLHSSWFILGELVRIASGKPYRDYVREHLFQPLGMLDAWIGMPADFYHANTERICTMPNTASAPPVPSGFDTERWCMDCRPGGSGYGPIRELGRFYEMMLNGGELGGTRVIEPETIELFAARHREDMHDKSFDHVIDWGLGFILNSAHHGVKTVPYGFGPHASEQTYGHAGYQSSIGFADPEHGLAVGIVFNGMPGEAAHQKRIYSVLGALYADLGLA
jgi:CubicO group peptidase (beta-lactamase class C family)